jgi:hypothetical protein
MPPKYAIAGGIDFYEELKLNIITPAAITNPKPHTEESIGHQNDNNGQECLLSKTPLTYGHITLPCAHTFNFLPLYNEILSQKTNPILLKNIYHVILNKNHIRCPYCRAIHADVLLPYIVGDKRVTGVNGPSTSCMPTPFKCEGVTRKMTGRGSKRHEVVTECGAVRDIYYCEMADESIFLCKRHRTQRQKHDAVSASKN